MIIHSDVPPGGKLSRSEKRTAEWVNSNMSITISDEDSQTGVFSEYQNCVFWCYYIKFSVNVPFLSRCCRKHFQTEYTDILRVMS
jgi:hypothetical protein